MNAPGIWWAIALSALAGCASLPPELGVQEPFASNLRSESTEVRQCAEWYRALDEATAAAAASDAQHARVAGFPYLRVDRVHSSLRDRAGANEVALQAFAERLLALEIESRSHEIENLPRSGIDVLPGMDKDTPRAFVHRQTGQCSRLLRELDLAKPAARAALLRAALVPDDYSDASRLLGLYPLTRMVFSSGVRRWEEESAAAFRAGFNPAAETSLVRYAPPVLPPISRAAVAALLDRAQLDPLGVPVLSERELARVAAAYAPSFEVAIGADYDRFGQLGWLLDARFPAVDTSQATVYAQQAYTRYQGQVLLQLVYTLWFPERPADGAGDILAGRLDGVMWRVTLAPDGEPLVYDSIHPCGCYHLFFPTPRARPRPAPDPREEWAFVPLSLPRVAENERPVVSIASRTHYIERVGLVRGSDSVARYALRDYDELRSLQRLEGGRRSVFGPDGLIAGTERAERFLFWPMGVRSAGAMRQWGRHATAFVGRRHFDDADLLERRFELDLAQSGAAKGAQ